MIDFLDFLINLVGWAHVLLAPYTKVEESFNLHATHDVLSYGLLPDALSNYDQNTFPGAVPRTFIGSIVLALSSIPLIFVESRNGPLGKLDVQIIVRLILSTWNAFGICLVRRAISRRFGSTPGIYFTLLSITQFHLPFWMGRTLPNMFALLPVNVALAFLIDRLPKMQKPSSNAITSAIALLTFATVVFRAELLFLLGPIVLQLLWQGHVTFKKLVLVGLAAGSTSLALTVSIDSYFWGKPYLWPEFSGLYFNVYEGKSSDWGTSPAHAYWTTHIPKLLMSSLPLSLVGIVADSRTRSIILPYAFFVALLSFLGHKEWRFIIYIVPAFNIAAAVGLRHLTTWSKRAQNQAGKTLSFTILPSFLCINLLFTYLLSLTSQNNYPGGDALVLLHKLYPVDQYPSAHVHMCNLAAQTGASLFLQANAPPFPPFSPSNATTFSWTYDKTEHLSMEDLTAQQSITHLIVETRPDEKTKRDWEVVGSVWAFERWALDLGLVKESNEVEVKGAEGAKGLLDRVLKMVKQEKLWILHRKS